MGGVDEGESKKGGESHRKKPGDSHRGKTPSKAKSKATAAPLAALAEEHGPLAVRTLAITPRRAMRSAALRPARLTKSSSVFFISSIFSSTGRAPSS